MNGYIRRRGLKSNRIRSQTDALVAGTRALVDAGYPAKLVDKAVNETEELQPLALKARKCLAGVTCVCVWGGG